MVGALLRFESRITIIISRPYEVLRAIEDPGVDAVKNVNVELLGSAVIRGPTTLIMVPKLIINPVAGITVILSDMIYDDCHERVDIVAR